MNPKSKRFKNMLEEAQGEKLSMRETQMVLLEMMKALHDFCTEHGIRYAISDGSLLGAVRHKGFIPWDDDMDVYMPRPDYERFIKYSRLNDRYSIVTYKNDHGYYHPFAYAVICDDDTVMVENDMRRPTGKGQFLDIFPLDGVTEDEKLRAKQFKKLKILSYIKGIQSIDVKKHEIKSFKDFVKWVCAILLTPVDEFKVVAEQDRLAQLADFDSCSTVSELILGNDRYVLRFDSDYFEKTELAPFEKYSFNITSEWDRYLKMEYGDYMQLPPESERQGKHSVDLYYRKKH